MGRALVDQAEYRDLVRRHATVQSLADRAAVEIAETEQRLGKASPAAARRLEIDLISKRNFHASLVARLAELADGIAAHEQRQKATIAALFGVNEPEEV